MNSTLVVSGTLRACRPGVGRPPVKVLLEMVIAELRRVQSHKLLPLRIRQWATNMLFKVAPIRGGSKGNTYENDLLKLLFNATAIANVADNASSSPLTNLSVALHTADPGEAGDQTTSETSYGSYARVSVARSSGGWTVTTNSVSPVAAIDFPAATSGTATITHGSVGPTGGGATKIFYSGAISPNIGVSTGVTPRLATTSTFTED